jgi:hypothetical protein
MSFSFRAAFMLGEQLESRKVNPMCLTGNDFLQVRERQRDIFNFGLTRTAAISSLCTT